MHNMIADSGPRRQANRDMTLVIAFGLFSYVLLSLWGYLVAQDVGVILSPRRLVSCAIGAGIFWVTLSRLRQQRRVELGTVVGSIVIAGLTILAARLGIDQLSASPIEPEHSVRWSLAWSGYFGIWLLAAVPPCAPMAFRGGRPQPDDQAGQMVLDDVYLEQLLTLPDGERERLR